MDKFEETVKWIEENCVDAEGNPVKLEEYQKKILRMAIEGKHLVFIDQFRRRF